MKLYYRLLKKSPGQSRSQHLVDSVLLASSEILEQEGVREFTIEKVAQKAGVSVGSLYQYFSSKDNVIVATLNLVAEKILNEVLENQLSKLKKIDDPRIAIEFIVDSGLVHLLQNPKRIKYLYSLVISLGIQSTMMQYRELYRKKIVECLLKFIRPELDEEKVQLVSYVLVNSVLGISVSYMNGYTPNASIEQVKSELKAMTWSYVAPYLIDSTR